MDRARRVEIEAHIEHVQRSAVLIDDALDGFGEVPHRSGKPGDLRDDDPVDLTAREIVHEIGVTRSVGARPAALVGVDLD